jgi:hypothetical protein
LREEYGGFRTIAEEELMIKDHIIEKALAIVKK